MRVQNKPGFSFLKLLFQQSGRADRKKQATKTMEYTNTVVDTQNVNEAKSELEILGSGLQGQTSIEEHRKGQLMQHIKDLKNNNQGWLNRLLLPKEDKALLRAFGEKELEAAEIALGSQNKALAAICDGQVSFIKEVVNTMLKTGRSGLKGAAATIYKENALAMQSSITRISGEFYTLVETKYRDAETRLPFVQKQMMAEIELMMRKWSEDTLTIQNDFSTILQENV
jgi:hypothetical protein